MPKRVCTQCGAEVGTSHKRTKLFIYKKSMRNKIINAKEAAALKIVQLGAKN